MSEIKWRLHWSGTVWYGFCPNAEVWEEERDRVSQKTQVDIGEYMDDRGLSTFYETPDHRVLVTIGDWYGDEPIQLLGVICHEAVHVAMHAFSVMVEKEPGEEVLAYSIDGIARHVFEDYCETRGKKISKRKKR